MGHYLDSIFGNRVSVFIAAIASILATVCDNIIGEMGMVLFYISLATGTLFVSDTILGSIVACHMGKFNSKGFARALEKIIVYTLAIVGMTAFGVLIATIPMASGIPVSEQSIGTVARIFFSWTMLLIGLTEFISVVENLRVLGFKVPKNIDKLISWMNDKLCQVNLSQDGNDEDVIGRGQELDREGQEGQDEGT